MYNTSVYTMYNRILNEEESIPFYKRALELGVCIVSYMYYYTTVQMI